MQEGGFDDRKIYFENLITNFMGSTKPRENKLKDDRKKMLKVLKFDRFGVFCSF